MSGAGEDDLIARYFAPWAGAGGFALKDDAAAIPAPAGQEIVLTVDALVAGVHFFPHDPPGAIAKKALRVNLSDLAAKGADPLGFLLALSLPKSWTADWMEAFSQGLREDALAFACPLLGGDTTRTPGPLTLSITALGAAPHGAMVKRFGARPGDAIYVTGTIGDAALGLACREGLAGLGAADRAFLEDRYLLPRPRNAAARAMRRHARGGMDVSDGFVGDLAKMMRASGCGARVELARVPFSDAARAAILLDPSLRDMALTGGDDYELLASVAPCEAGAFEEAMRAAGVAATRVGTAVANGLTFIEADGAARAFARGSFQHF